MTLGEKLRYLRTVEGTLRGLDRELTQLEVSTLLGNEQKGSMSQSYLSQIEGGRRRHLTHRSRTLLAGFFRVHPGYLVDDPEGYEIDPGKHPHRAEDRLDLWLIDGAQRFQKDPAVSAALIAIARHGDSRKCLMLMEEILQNPEMIDRLLASVRRERRRKSRGAAPASNNVRRKR